MNEELKGEAVLLSHILQGNQLRSIIWDALKIDVAAKEGTLYRLLICENTAMAQQSAPAERGVVLPLIEHCDLLDSISETWTEIKVDTLRELCALASLNPAPAEPIQCDTCHGQGEVFTGESQSFGYMSMQPPEPIMEVCPECSGEGITPAEQQPAPCTCAAGDNAMQIHHAVTCPAAKVPDCLNPQRGPQQPVQQAEQKDGSHD